MIDSLFEVLEGAGRTYLITAAVVFVLFFRMAIRLILDPPQPKFTSLEVFNFFVWAVAASLSWPVLLWESVRDGVRAGMHDRCEAQVVEFLHSFKEAAEKMAKEHTAKEHTANKEDPK